MSPSPYRFGIIGFGNIGAGTIQTLHDNREQIHRMAGREIELAAVADIDWSRDRGVDLGQARKETDAQAVVQAEDIDAVVELVGGTGVAYEIVMSALEAGKDVVTANKALLAVHGKDIFRLATKKGRSVMYEASVGGGIPLIQSYDGGMSAARVTEFYGILNGTCNYILSSMAKDGREYQAVLQEAIDLGYAEPDPTFDVEGTDAGHKVCILASKLFNTAINFDAIQIEGIGDVTLDDIQFGERLGYTLKLLAIGKDHGDCIETRVHPTFVSSERVLASVSGSYNAVYTYAPGLEGTLLYGRGAGPLPTGNAVLSDMVQLARQVNGRSPVPYTNFFSNGKGLLPLREAQCSYYMKFMVGDHPGVLAQISGLLGERNISIQSVIQLEGEGDGVVPLVLMTHTAKEGDVRIALDRINALSITHAVPRIIRVENIPV